MYIFGVYAIVGGNFSEQVLSSTTGLPEEERNTCQWYGEVVRNARTRRQLRNEA